MPDDDFTPKLGRKRGKDGKLTQKYGGRILAAARLAGTKTGVRSRRFDGSRIGRGASMGRLLSGRDQLAGFRSRRAVVKASLIRLQGKAGQAARAHMRYIQRDGVTREGLPGELYGPETDCADGDDFLKRTVGATERAKHYLETVPGASGVILAIACTAVVFVAGGMLLDFVRKPVEAAPVPAANPALTVRRRRTRAFNRTGRRAFPKARGEASRG